jgi:hypothetical protein
MDGVDMLRNLGSFKAICLACLMFSAPAKADETRYASDAYWQRTWRDYVGERSGNRHRPYRHKPQVRAWKHVHRPPEPPPVPPLHAARCLAETRAVGNPHLTQDEAMESAKRHWQAQARYDHGELYMDIASARHVKARCSRAETNETAAGRAVETITGGTAWRQRCEIVAHPCRPALGEVTK